jgi:2-C-methyl-D-erythritol 4-phosphate cytidylyltransferase
MTSIGIILAGGIGSRMNIEMPKQFMLLAGKPVIQYSIEKFIQSEAFQHILVVCHPDYFEQVPKIASEQTQIHSIAGGKSRNDSTWNAIDFIQNSLMKDGDAKLLFHDAARPNVKIKTVYELLSALDHHAVAVPVSKLNDTIYETDLQGNFAGIKSRDHLVKAHTPQAFWFSVIRDAYRIKSAQSEVDFTDDVSIVKAFIPDTEISFIEDDPWNIKLTQPEDFSVLEALLGD